MRTSKLAVYVSAYIFAYSRLQLVVDTYNAYSQGHAMHALGKVHTEGHLQAGLAVVTYVFNSDSRTKHALGLRAIQQNIRRLCP